jgi:hypothetical protein
MPHVDASLAALLSSIPESNVYQRSRAVNIAKLLPEPHVATRTHLVPYPQVDAFTNPRENSALDVVLKAARNASILPPRVSPLPGAETVAVQSIGVDLTADVATVADGILSIFLHMKQKYVRLLQHSTAAALPGAAAGGGGATITETAAMTVGSKLERTSQLAEVRETHERAKEGLTVLVQKVIYVESEMKAIVLENGRVKKENAELKRIRVDLENAQRKLDLELQGMRRSIYKLVEMRQISDEGLAILDAQKINAQNEKTGLEILKAKTQAKESKFAIKKLELDLKNKDAELILMQSQLDTQTNQNATLLSTIDQLNNQIASLNKNVWDEKAKQNSAVFDQFVFKEKYNQKSQTDPWIPEEKIVYRETPKPISKHVAVNTRTRRELFDDVAVQTIDVIPQTISAQPPTTTINPQGPPTIPVQEQPPTQDEAAAVAAAAAAAAAAAVAAKAAAAAESTKDAELEQKLKLVEMERRASIPPGVGGRETRHVQTEFSKELGMPAIYRRLEKLANGEAVKYGQLRADFGDHMEEMLEAGLYKLNEQAKSLDKRAEELVQPHLLSRFIALVEFHHEVGKIQDVALREKLLHIVAFLQKDLVLTISHICKFCRRLVTKKEQEHLYPPLPAVESTNASPLRRHLKEQQDLARNSLKFVGISQPTAASLQILGSSGDFDNLWNQSTSKPRLGNFGRLLAQQAANSVSALLSGPTSRTLRRAPTLPSLKQLFHHEEDDQDANFDGDDESDDKQPPRIFKSPKPRPKPKQKAKPLQSHPHPHPYKVTPLEIFPTLPELLGLPTHHSHHSSPCCVPDQK